MSLSRSRLIAAIIVAASVGIGTAHAQTDATAPAPTSKKAARKQNHQLETKVRHTLGSSKEIDTSGIMIVARGGSVTLDGTATDDAQIQLAGTTTAKVPGVTRVTNNLRVREAGH
ncbi:BON domain-containing protein [Caballeronia sp. LZ035]|uniref:BON domain-containing protein n=1 Tax=Caballeronia sp. LZ035 TaxID=3038568 RepID=UPI0028662265|nr:BON domain-containing protein [Caballeronia sp. LZ035]MDR5760850.1 BON domain-containing protein [Caballeronia sp. LZ035]